MTMPRLTNLMNPDFFNKSAMGIAWQAQKDQPFGKDSLRQVFTTERAFPHVVFPLIKEGFLDLDDMKNLFAAMPSSRTLWNEYQQVKDIDWTPRVSTILTGKTKRQLMTPASTCALRCIFITILDLAAVHQKTRGNHVAAHRTKNPKIILQQVQGLMDRKNYDHLKRILVDGCPTVFRKEATYEQYWEMHQYGNHKSVEQNLEKVVLTMNKDDCKDHVLTFLAFLAEFIQDLMLMAQGFVMLPGKNDCLVFDALFLLSLLSQPFNHQININNKPEKIFG
jgi:hypothetical protein